nr:MucR family transcriptional regulator [Rhizobium rhizogenes]
MLRAGQKETGDECGRSQHSGQSPHADEDMDDDMTQSREAKHAGPNEIRETIMDAFSSKKDLTQLQASSLSDGCVKIVSAYVSHNTVPIGSLSKLITDVHEALQTLDGTTPSVERSKPVPAVDLKKSVTNDYIICLEDGKRFKTLKRHLRVHYGMTPEEYRQKWGLAPTYPMVAQNYANRRSELAKLSGLGANGNKKDSVR